MKEFLLIGFSLFAISHNAYALDRSFERALGHAGIFLFVVFIILTYQFLKITYNYLFSRLKSKRQKNLIPFVINYDYLILAILTIFLGYSITHKFKDNDKEYVTDPQILKKLNDPSYKDENSILSWDQIDKLRVKKQEEILHDTAYISANDETKDAIRKKYKIEVELIDVRLPDGRIIKNLPKDIKQSELIFLFKKTSIGN
jgi:hypothetical protein